MQAHLDGLQWTVSHRTLAWIFNILGDTNVQPVLRTTCYFNAFISVFSKLARTFFKKCSKWGPLKHMNSLSFPWALPTKDGQGMHTRVVGSSVSAYPHPRHSDFLIKLHLLNTKVQRTDLGPVSPELPYCKNAHLCRLKPPSLWQLVRAAPENQPAATCYHTGGRQQGRDARQVNCFRDDDTVLTDAQRAWCSYMCWPARATKAARLPAFVLTWLVLSRHLYREPSWTDKTIPLISSPRENL